MIQGFVESIAVNSVIGWAYDDDDPVVRLAIRARVGDRELGRTEAKILRRDLRRRWGDNDGAHGFTVALEGVLTLAQLAELTVEAARPASEAWNILQHFVSPHPVAEEAHAGALENAAQRAEDAARRAEDAAQRAASPRVVGWPAIAEFWSDDPNRINAASEDSFPVFVLGSVRSGTSALCAALVQATRYRGFYEGHLLDVAVRMVDAVDAHLDKKNRLLPATAIANFHLGRHPRPRVRAALHQFFTRLAAGYTTPFWFDKSPSREMVLSAPLLAQIWPEARFIFMKRRGLENVMSRARKFSGGRFAMQCQEWALIMADWRTVRTVIPDKFVELEQRALLDDPGGVAERVGALLSLSRLEIEAMQARLEAVRTEVTDPTARVLADIAETGWSPEMIETFRAACGAEMAAYGYTYDERYCI